MIWKRATPNATPPWGARGWRTLGEQVLTRGVQQAFTRDRNRQFAAATPWLQRLLQGHFQLAHLQRAVLHAAVAADQEDGGQAVDAVVVGQGAVEAVLALLIDVVAGDG